MISPVKVTYGCDPEIFLHDGKKIVGSERFIPKEGLVGKVRNYNAFLVARDGIQAEIHPPAGPTIQHVGIGISAAFTALLPVLKTHKLGVCWDELVTVEREELEALSEESQALGCQPSKNIYGDRPIMVNGWDYPKRSAGGHLHFGLTSLPKIWSQYKNIEDHRTRVIGPLDVIVGNMCVLLDRDPGNAERRENYGRAGEFRDDKTYGIEYRTLSNFWLRSYSLMDLVFGMGNFCVSLVNESLSGNDIEAELVEAVDIMNVIRAIEGNDFDLAMDNFTRIMPFLSKYLPKTGFPLGPDRLTKFLRFAGGVKQNGLAAYFPQDPVEHWIGGEQVPFDSFLNAV